jgi:hypothetical protein
MEFGASVTFSLNEDQNSIEVTFSFFLDSLFLFYFIFFLGEEDKNMVIDIIYYIFLFGCSIVYLVLMILKVHDLAIRFSSDASKALIALIITTFLLSIILIGLHWQLRILEKKFELSDASTFTEDGKKLRNRRILGIVLGLIHAICSITVILLALGIDDSVREIALIALQIPVGAFVIWLISKIAWCIISAS